jgi:glycosyltransferase involved in cell wall biosynthesis
MKRLRVLHVLGAMNVGGVETWLMHVLSHLDRDKFQIDLLVHTDEPAVYDSEVLATGARILRCPPADNPLLYAARFLQIAKRNGPFDVLHSHVHHFSGFILALGRIAGIPVRIAHSHSDTSVADLGAPIARRAYLGAMERLIRAHCTGGFSVSEPAAAALFGRMWASDRRFRVFYCGIDLAPFRCVSIPDAVRAEFGFSRDEVVFGHVGRFLPSKNHMFFLDVAACILTREPHARFLLVGDGPLRAEVEKRARLLGLGEKIVFAGPRSDVPRLMMGAMDVFMLPSLHEGLPLVLMETQAAGLPCVASEALTEEAILNPLLVHRLPLSAGADEWARVACETANRPRFDRDEAVETLDGSRFDIKSGVRKMCDIYLAQVSAAPIRKPATRRLITNKRV